jgi:hypothetical protein
MVQIIPVFQTFVFFCSSAQILCYSDSAAFPYAYFINMETEIALIIDALMPLKSVLTAIAY